MQARLTTLLLVAFAPIVAEAQSRADSVAIAVAAVQAVRPNFEAGATVVRAAGAPAWHALSRDVVREVASQLGAFILTPPDSVACPGVRRYFQPCVIGPVAMYAYAMAPAISGDSARIDVFADEAQRPLGAVLWRVWLERARGGWLVVRSAVIGTS